MCTRIIYCGCLCDYVGHLMVQLKANVVGCGYNKKLITSHYFTLILTYSYSLQCN